ncbi:aldehyde dehydrogenase [Meredithblackwellia eburnea MCA 4105]
MSAIESRLFINGKFCEAKSGKKFKLFSPATEELVAEVAEADADDVDAAVEAALAAQPAWAATAASEKSRLLNKLADAAETQVAEFARIEGLSMGIPSSVFAGYLHGLTGALRLAAALTLTKQGVSSTNKPGFVNFTLRCPYVVVGAILPWNVPLTMFGFKVGPALAAGNTIVVKTSEKTPLTALLVCKLAQEIGIPPGVINVVSGFGRPCGEAIASHMKIRKVTQIASCSDSRLFPSLTSHLSYSYRFTGSLRTGRAISKAAIDSNLKAVTLELGGKSPVIVFDDADIVKAAKASAFSMFRNSGQICGAHSRVYVQKTIADKFTDLYVKEWNDLVVHGLPSDPATTQGPMADSIQFKSVMNFIEEAKMTATVKTGGHRVGEKGFYVAPTVFTNVKDTDRINREEVFGPVAVVHTFETEEEAVTRANDTEYGLWASVFTNDLNKAFRIVTGLEAGSCSVNSLNGVAFDMPFGGFKGSGLGREMGPGALEPFLETKSVFFDVASALPGGGYA